MKNMVKYRTFTSFHIIFFTNIKKTNIGLIVACLTTSGKYFMYIQDESNLCDYF
jgi:hypothetical protein